MGYFAYFIWVGSLLFFFYDGYNAATTQEYMSLDSSSGACDTVSNEISDSFLADGNGFWETSPQFRASHASYLLKMKSLVITNPHFQHMMSNIKEAIDVVAEGAPRRSLYENLLYWTTWEYSIPQTVSTFYFKADISTIFNKRYNYATVSSSLGSCPVQPASSYDVKSATYTISFDANNYTRYGCEAIVDHIKMGYVSFTDSFFDIKIDMTAFMIASAVSEADKRYNMYVPRSCPSTLSCDACAYMCVIQINNGVLDQEVLEVIDSTYFVEYTDEGDIVADYGMYFHPRYPNHTPVFCGVFYTIYKPDGIFICSLAYGSRYAVPVLNHAGDLRNGLNLMCNW